MTEPIWPSQVHQLLLEPRAGGRANFMTFATQFTAVLPPHQRTWQKTTTLPWGAMYPGPTLAMPLHLIDTMTEGPVPKN